MSTDDEGENMDEIFYLTDPDVCEHPDAAIVNAETRMDLVDTGFCTECEAPVERDETQPEWHL